MNNQVKTNAELIEKISCLNQRIRELKQTESDRKQAEEVPRGKLPGRSCWACLAG